MCLGQQREKDRRQPCHHQGFSQGISEHWGTVLYPSQHPDHTTLFHSLWWHKNTTQLSRQTSESEKETAAIFKCHLVHGSCWNSLLHGNSLTVPSLGPLWAVRLVWDRILKPAAASTPVHTQPLPSPHTTGITAAQAAAASLFPAQDRDSYLCFPSFHLHTVRRSCLLRSNCREPWLIPQLSWLLFSPHRHWASVFTNPEGQAVHGTLGIFLWVPQVSL